MSTIQEHTVNDRIMRLIELFKLTPNSFATKLNVSSTLIYNIEKSRNKPGYDLLLSISKVFNVNCNWLILGIGSIFLDVDPDDSNKRNVGKRFVTNVGKSYKTIDGFKETEDGISPIYRTEPIYEKPTVLEDETAGDFLKVPLEIRHDVMKRLILDIYKMDNEITRLSESINTVSIFRYISNDIETEYFRDIIHAEYKLADYFKNNSVDYNSYRDNVLNTYKQRLNMLDALTTISEAINLFYIRFKPHDDREVIKKYLGVNI